jgi:hypothetical protein
LRAFTSLFSWGFAEAQAQTELHRPPCCGYRTTAATIEVGSIRAHRKMSCGKSFGQNRGSIIDGPKRRAVLGPPIHRTLR